MIAQAADEIVFTRNPTPVLTRLSPAAAHEPMMRVETPPVSSHRVVSARYAAQLELSTQYREIFTILGEVDF